MNHFIASISSFAKKHTLLTPLIAAIVFIFITSCSLIYANVLLYDYQPSSTTATGIGATASIKDTFIHYDSGWFLSVAEHGYKNLDDYAFLPLYPLAITAFKHITPLSYDWSAIVLSWLILCATTVVIFKWFEFEIKKRDKDVSPWLPLGLLAIFPTALYLALPYSDGLFMLLNVGAIFAYRKDKYWLAMVLAALSSATRYQGVLLFIYFACDWYFSKKRDYRKLIPAIGAFIGLLGYMLFLKIHTGSAFEFLTAERQWGRLHGNIFIDLIKSLRPIELWFIAVAIYGLRLIKRTLDKPLFIYSLAFILEPLLSGTFTGLNRYMLNMVALFMALAFISEKQIHHSVRLIYVLSSAFLAGWFVLFVANNYLVG